MEAIDVIDVIEELETRERKETKKKPGLSGSTLKLIAIVSMTIDHIGAAILSVLLAQESAMFGSVEMLGELYSITRKIGRIAFPIYCFLLVEGFYHTSDRKRYALRLAVFALISEIPFDLAFYQQVIWTGHQNVFFELLLGLVAICLMDRIKNHGILIASIACVLAVLFNLDYNCYGILAIVVMYLLRQERWKQCLMTALVFSWELPAPLSSVFLFFYNGERGIRIKYFFYLFYPMHLLLLYLVRVLLLNL